MGAPLAAGLGRPSATRLPLSVDLLLALAVGALQVPAYSPQLLGVGSLWWLPMAAGGWLCWRAASAPGPGRAFMLGWFYGTAWLVAGTGWLYISMHRYGGLPSWLAGLAVLALSAFLALYLALAMSFFARWRSGRALSDGLLFGALWLAAELARGILFTGFPWAGSGYAQVDGPLAVLAPWVGVYGIGALAAALVAAIVSARTLPARGVAAGVLAALVAAGSLLAPAGFTQPAGRLQVSLLQGNVPQEQKFSPEHLPETLIWYGRAIVAAQGDLVLAPETAIPLLPSQMPEDYWEAIQAAFAKGGRSALIGVPLGDERHGYSNSVAGLSPDTVALKRGIYQYDKHHLVPFGEFIPFGFRWFVDLMRIPLGDFNRGSLVQPPFAVRTAAGATQWVAPNICYEDLFGEELAARLVSGEHEATVFANVSNIAWFGDELAIAQHLQISRMRTLELQRPMIRATNTGATVVIDHTGHVTHALQPLTRGVLVAEVEGRRGLTPYARWAGAFGLWPLIVLGAGVPAWRWAAARRARGARQEP